MNRHPFTPLIFHLLIILSILSCSPPPPIAANTFVIAMDTPPKNLHPHFAFDLNAQLVDELLFESLVVLGADTLPQCTRLCNAWTFVTPTELVFTLSEALIQGQIKFADGSAITPEDILASIRVMKHEENPFQGAFTLIQSETFEAPNKIHVMLKESKPSLPIDFFLVKILKANQAIFPQVDATQLIASGPYVLKQSNPNTLWLDLNPHYAALQPYHPLELQFIHDEQTRLFKFMRNEVQAIFNAVPFKSAERFQKDKTAQVLSSPGWNITYLGINHQDPLLKDPSIRHYLYESLNIHELIQYKLYAFGIQHFSLLPIDSPFVDSKTLQAQAMPTLTAAQRKQAKAKLKKSTLVLKTSNESAVMSIVRVIQSQLMGKGIRIKHQPMEFGVLMEDLKAGNFQLSYGKFVGITDPAVFYDFLHSSFMPPNGRNRGRFQNTVWDSLSKTLSQEVDPNQRKILTSKLQEIFAQELPLIPLWVTKNIITLDNHHTLSTVSTRQSLRDFMTLQSR